MKAFESLPEAALVERAKQGDVRAFERLIRGYEDRIYGLAHRVCAGAPAEADDIYQETFLTAFRKIGQFRSRSRLGTWLYRIAANLCWMRLRKRRGEPVVPLLSFPLPHDGAEGGPGEPRVADWSADPAARAGKRELAEAVAGALGALPVEYRLAVALRDIQGLSNEETAQVLGIGVAAVKSRLHRGRLFLRDRLQDYVQGRAS
jgi:RNA polymerase sigma-70 factor (ECF subfamily)